MEDITACSSSAVTAS